MANQEYPSLDGFAPSWADITVTLTVDGGELLEMGDIAAISSGDTLEIGEQRGPGGIVRARTAGSVSQEASMTIYMSALPKLLRALAKNAPKRGNQRRIGLVKFDILQEFTPEGSTEIYRRKIKGCRVTGRSLAAAEGSDAQQLEIPLNPMQVVDIIDGEEIVLN